MPSPRYCTLRWQRLSRPPLPEWSEPSATPSKLPGTGAIWTPCKGFSAFYLSCRCNEDMIDRSKIGISIRWTFFVVPMNTPALLGEFYPNEQEYFLYKKFELWVTYQWIYALLPHHTTTPGLSRLRITAVFHLGGWLFFNGHTATKQSIMFAIMKVS